jgi:deazaflavin-dependent oxidoreductase (nitroreductase family)
MDVLELVTTGHRSGEPRSVLLFYMMDDGSPIVVGSNLGADHEPAWILNLRSNPTARMKVDGVTSDVTAVFIDEPDRSEIFDRFKSAYGDYAVYDSMTERTIPIVRLVGQG